MKTLFDRVNEVSAPMLAPLKKFPLAFRGLGLMLALTLYAAGILLVDRITDIGFVVVLVALYFLPALLRAWLLFYWQLRDDISALRARRSAKVL
ncbi:MAG: hypothetical protein ACK4SX_13690 [Alcanivoracaceae bacterium]